MIKWLGFLMFLTVLVVLSGCQNAVSGIHAQNKDYKMPQDYVPVVYTVSMDHPQAYDMQVFVVEEPEDMSKMQQWREWRERVESQDRYDTLRKLYDNDKEDKFYQSEEDRIEDYCKEAGFSRCKNIDRTCEKYGCHRVVVICDDDSYNPGIDDLDECRKFDVDVEEDIDKELTGATEEEED